jgi:hypothetical protein
MTLKSLYLFSACKWREYARLWLDDARALAEGPDRDFSLFQSQQALEWAKQDEAKAERFTCGVEQMEARQPHKLKVAGSSPAPATNAIIELRGIGQSQ